MRFMRPEASRARLNAWPRVRASGPVPSGGGYVYRIKWLTDDGAVLYVIADAETGEILSVEGE